MMTVAQGVEFDVLYFNLTLSSAIDNPPSVLEQWARRASGVHYQRDVSWTYRLGVAYDESPVPHEMHRTPRLLDGHRLWLALGISYAPLANLRLDLG